MRHLLETVHGLKPVILMILVQFILTGMNIFYKLAANDGMNMRVLVAYRSILSAAFTVPLALIFERKYLTKLTWVIIVEAFFCGLFGATLAQNLYVESLVLTSATFSVAITNLCPAVTLILATSFGLEKVRLGTTTDKAKVFGILIGIGGAMVFTFYKGVEIKIWSTNVDLLKHKNHTQLHKDNSTSHHIIGSCLAFASCVCFGMWLIIQSKLSKKFPYHYSSAALMSLMGSIQSVIFALSIDRSWSQWKLGWNLRLLAAAYSGIVTSGVVLTLIAWCVSLRGPVFVASFNPLCLVLVAIAGSLMLEEQLHLGSILGAGLIVCGLYILLWGQNKEIKEKAKLLPKDSSSTNHELLKVVVDDDHGDGNGNAITTKAESST
ncbi:WAT1-related protein At1g25270-like isoform X1 [Mercurialis annua]|uniref:WAT1-related protein At1g25270-like isoform X1 n=1 Tax=Mercurialis annua TaxID=3986 RepID=UPI00216006E1|nr:WAT1-related protein At1g25270-like isoform X1 [Mercurialis annua]